MKLNTFEIIGLIREFLIFCFITTVCICMCLGCILPQYFYCVYGYEQKIEGNKIIWVKTNILEKE